MDEIENNLQYFQDRRRHSVNYCLWTLGASRDEVYFHANTRVLRLPCKAARRSIYNKYSR
jgi:hypothetical protein